MQQSNIHSIHSVPTATTEIASVISKTKVGVIVDTSIGHIAAKISASCLLQPSVGDTVLIVTGRNSAFVTSVLEQASQSEAQVLLPAKACLGSKGSEFTIRSSNQINLQTNKLNMAARDVELSTPKLNVYAAEQNISGQKLNANINDVTVVADSHSSVIGRVTQKANQVVRWVESVETLSIGNLFKTVRENMIMRSKQGVITSEEDMKIDAKRIHMG